MYVHVPDRGEAVAPEDVVGDGLRVLCIGVPGEMNRAQHRYASTDQHAVAMFECLTFNVAGRVLGDVKLGNDVEAIVHSLEPVGSEVLRVDPDHERLLIV